MITKKLAILCSFALFLALPAPSIHAMIITIEPDDYAEGTDLSEVSPYVTLQSQLWRAPRNTISGPVYASTPYYSTAATGRLTFGSYSYEHGGGLGADISSFQGFTMNFHQEVNQVALLATNAHWYEQRANWVAFDRDGKAIAFGRQLGYSNQPFLLDIRLEGIWSVVVGGDTGHNYQFDHLIFNTSSPDVEVPEPGTLSLSLLGVAAVVWRSARRRYPYQTN